MFHRDPTTAKIGLEILPFEMGYLPEFFQKKGEEELNYTESRREMNLQKFKDAMAKDRATKDVRMTDEMLLLYLNSRKYDLDKAFSQMKKYLKFRKEKDIIFTVPSFEVLCPIMANKFITVLPWRCQDGCAVIFIQSGLYNSELYSVLLVQQFYTLILFQCLRYPMTQVNGFKFIVDFNVTLEILRICTPQNVYVFIYILQVILPGRLKGVHFVNMNLIGRTAWKMIRIFLSKKIKERVHIHQRIDDLKDFFPRAILPVKYGGDLEDFDMTDWLKRVSSPEEILWASCF